MTLSLSYLSCLLCSAFLYIYIRHKAIDAPDVKGTTTKSVTFFYQNLHEWLLASTTFSGAANPLDKPSYNHQRLKLFMWKCLPSKIYASPIPQSWGWVLFMSSIFVTSTETYMITSSHVPSLVEVYMAIICNIIRKMHYLSTKNRHYGKKLCYGPPLFSRSSLEGRINICSIILAIMEEFFFRNKKKHNTQW